MGSKPLERHRHHRQLRQQPYGDAHAGLAALDLPATSDRTGGTPALIRIWRLAIEFDVIQLRRTRVLAGSGASLIANTLAGAAEPEQVLDFWSDLADELLDPPAPAIAPKNGEHLRDWMRPWMPRFLGILYTATASSEPAVLDTMIDQLLDEYERRLPPGDPALFAGLAAAVVRNTLSDLASRNGFACAILLGVGAPGRRPDCDFFLCLRDTGTAPDRTRGTGQLPTPGIPFGPWSRSVNMLQVSLLASADKDVTASSAARGMDGCGCRHPSAQSFGRGIPRASFRGHPRGGAEGLGGGDGEPAACSDERQSPSA
ncbi:hypothetical protein [Paractinoplanes durhamensis]|uniref:Uncharacterized protein n=1 Tax=Paractinoplanes durhamensis TaxID=113563 RepID=A0ABQ3YY07_9ACTN|nr:hypothetical protein [Actinoplanes durhamensis]GIE02410.1 hypothetical protein Adu01nite_37600 [Actinoplanes durhamensis]